MEPEAFNIAILIPILLVAFGELFFYLSYLRKHYPNIHEWLRKESIFAYSTLPGVKPYNLFNDYKLMFKTRKAFVKQDIDSKIIEEYQRYINDKRYIKRKIYFIAYHCICIIWVLLAMGKTH